MEKNPVIARLWRYLIDVSPAEIRQLPLVTEGVVEDFDLPDEARWLIGFWLNKGTASPRHQPGQWMRSGIRPASYWGKEIRERIAGQVEQIRHWRVIEGTYEDAPTEETATWFVDPPYQVAGHHYPYSEVDYLRLGEWSRALRGQVMVCEHVGADWLPFRPFHRVKSTPGSKGKGHSVEVLWTAGDVG